jgi:hypothetical protein
MKKRKKKMKIKNGNKVREIRNARRIVSEVKDFFTTVFSVFQNLEKPTLLSKKKKKIYFGWGLVFPLFGNFAKKRVFWTFLS